MSGEFFNTMRKAIGIDGLISSIIGALILFLPNLSAKVASGMIGATLVVIGVFKLWTFFQLKSEGAMARFGNLLVAIIYMVAGIFIFVDMQSAAISLILVVGILTGMTWVIEGFVQLTILNQLANNKFWATLAAFVSILGGLSLLFSPVLGGLIVWTFFGVTLLVIGIVKLIQFATLKNS